MLLPADAALAARDQALPGLATVLDSEAVAQAVDRHLPELEVRKVTPHYVRYKPATSCMVAYRLAGVDGERMAYVKAWRGDASEKPQKLLHLPRRFAADALEPVALGGAVVLALFPWDRRLRAARRLGTAAGRADLLGAVLPRDLAEGASLVPLRYKPERRFVARVDGPEGPRAVLKCYTDSDYRPAFRAARAVRDADGLHTAQPLGDSERHRVLTGRWVPGACLEDLMADGSVDAAMLASVGAALAGLHAQGGEGLRRPRRDAQRAALRAAVDAVSTALPETAELARDVADRAALRLAGPGHSATPIHGDFSADQVLVAGGQLVIIDFDQAELGDPAADLGLFAANLEADVIGERLVPARAHALSQALMTGYTAAGGRDVRDGLAAATAGWLLRLAPEPFRHRRPDWPERTRGLLLRARELLR
jgi:aminoglycoside phosphotransferase (APT) family kinase protein